MLGEIKVEARFAMFAQRSHQRSRPCVFPSLAPPLHSAHSERRLEHARLNHKRDRPKPTTLTKHRSKGLTSGIDRLVDVVLGVGR